MTQNYCVLHHHSRLSRNFTSCWLCVEFRVHVEMTCSILSYIQTASYKIWILQPPEDLLRINSWIDYCCIIVHTVMLSSSTCNLTSVPTHTLSFVSLSLYEGLLKCRNLWLLLLWLHQEDFFHDFWDSVVCQEAVLDSHLCWLIGFSRGRSRGLFGGAWRGLHCGRTEWRGRNVTSTSRTEFLWNNWWTEIH
jgi:hypothetical protein